MNNNLIERYIYAVTKRLPHKNREDVSLELQGLIEDMLEERCQGTQPTEKDIRVVLTELGTPQELYAKYDEDADKCLIGQPYYSTYKFVLKIVLAAVTVGMLFTGLISQILEPRMWVEALGESISLLVDGLVGAFGFVTLLFAFFQYKGIRINESYNLDELPSVPKKKQEISRWDAIIGIGFDVVFLAIFLGAPQLLGMYRGDGSEIIPMFNVAAIRASWVVIVLFGALGIIREVVKLLEGRYNKKVLTVTVVTDVLSAGLAIWWLSGANLFNPAFVESILAQAGREDAVVIGIFERFPQFFLAVMIFALAMDVITTVVKSIDK